jgi:hypothetical protein
MSLKHTSEQRKIFSKLLNEGKTQKEASQIIGITEKTAGAWKKTLPSVIYSTQRNDIQKKISAVLNDPNSTVSDISKLTDAAIKLEKCIQYAINSPL